jgi:hypothetical protein
MDFFFEDDTVTDIVENHIQRLLSFEESQAEKIIRVYKEVRRDLRDRLEQTPRGSFTAERMRGTLVQVELAIDAMSRDLSSQMGDSAEKAAIKGIEDLVSELNKFNKHFTGAVVPINIDAVAVATDTDNFLVNRYEASINAYSQEVRSGIARSLTEAVVAQKNYDDVVGGLGRLFQAEEWKLHRLARTELHNMYSQGKLNGMSSLWDEGNGDIPDLKKALFHPMDSRTASDSKYVAAIDPVVPIDEPFKYRWDGKLRVFMSPPDRPNDRSILVPFRDGWKSK